MDFKKTYILALDVGTSSVRAAIYDENVNRLDATFVKNERQLHFTDDGGAEIDAEEALVQVVEAIEKVIKLAPEIIGQVEFIATSCFWHSLVGVDENGKALTPIYGWADTRSAEFVEVLRENLDETETHNRTGCRFHSSYQPAKLLWLKNEQPQVFHKVTRWLQFSDFMELRLFGENLTSVSMASGTGIFDIHKCDWDDELLNFLGIKRENLPNIEGDEKILCCLKDEFAEKFALLKDAKFLLAIGDGAANNVGANCLKREKAALMIGTSGAMRVAFAGDAPKVLPGGLFCYRIDRKRVLVGGALSDGGGLYRWLKENLRLKKNDDDIENEISANAPDAHGLTLLPFLAGERSTGYHETAKGAILGLTSATSAIEITQAALEAVAYRFAEIFENLGEIIEIKEIIASGGALRESPVWTQIIADVLQQNLNLPDTREASSRGVVILALENAGKIENIEELKTPDGACFMFNKKHYEIYEEARERHEKFYKMLCS